MDYLPRASGEGWQAIELSRLRRAGEGTVSLYARGRDYHKVVRARLQKLQDRMAESVGPFGHRVFADSAPVLEAELAARSGQGWRGKHTLILSREVGSLFFLGEIYVDLALPASAPAAAHCGSCQACIDLCPTQAIIAPHRLDAAMHLYRPSSMPLDPWIRPLIGNRICSCDDCQLVCPQIKLPAAAPGRLRRACRPERCSRWRTCWAGRGRVLRITEQPDPAHRPCALAAQCGGGIGQCPA
jgi:epoxyqueuosine reductase